MTLAYYLNYISGHHGSLSKVGGQPSHLPLAKPWPKEDDEYLGFLMQLHVDGSRIDLPGFEYIQLYQPIDFGDDPKPEIVLIPEGAPKNFKKNILEYQHADKWDIKYEERTDPDILPELKPSDEIAELFNSKLGGIDPWQNENSKTKFIGQITESPIGLNFGGTICSIYLNPQFDVFVKMN